MIINNPIRVFTDQNMTETPKVAEKQPDQADPQTVPEKAGADQRRVLVCLNCGHIWEAKAGTLRPQCFECKRQRVRSATAEEIAQYDQGTSKIALIPVADSRPNTAGKQPKNSPDQADKQVDPRVDPLILVDPPRRIPKRSPPKPSPSPSILPAFLLIVVLGVIAAMYYLFARAKRDQAVDQYYEEMAATAPPAPRSIGATLPGM